MVKYINRHTPDPEHMDGVSVRWLELFSGLEKMTNFILWEFFRNKIILKA